MPELHKLTPTLGVLQDRGFKVALVTDGRMSGASGKVPAAIHRHAGGGGRRRASPGSATATSSASTPVAGRLDVRVGDEEWAAREPATADLSHYHHGLGRELFAPFRAAVGPADEGAAVIGSLTA